VSYRNLHNEVGVRICHGPKETLSVDVFYYLRDLERGVFVCALLFIYICVRTHHHRLDFDFDHDEHDHKVPSPCHN
jgi:hypothetical protein